MSAAEMAESVRSSSLSEVVWQGPAGAPEVRGAVTLLRGDVPVLAFTYADEAVARSIADAATVAVTLTETRSTAGGFVPLLLRGRPRLVEDPRAEVFTDELLDQELRRFPPARVYADSPLLRREHWWYLPRLLVEVDLHSVEPFPARDDQHDHLLVVTAGGRVEVRLAGLLEAGDQTLTVDLVGTTPPEGPAVLFGQDASFPDLERWTQWGYHGRWDGERFRVSRAPARVGLAPAPGLLQRWRRQRTFERRCRAAIPPS